MNEVPIVTRMYITNIRQIDRWIDHVCSCVDSCVLFEMGKKVLFAHPSWFSLRIYFQPCYWTRACKMMYAILLSAAILSASPEEMLLVEAVVSCFPTFLYFNSPKMHCKETTELD